MGRTRQYAGRVNVIKRIKVGDRWPFAAVVEKNGKLVRDHVWLAGKDEHHPEGPLLPRMVRRQQAPPASSARFRRGHRSCPA
jgi:hypothetical protein